MPWRLRRGGLHHLLEAHSRYRSNIGPYFRKRINSEFRSLTRASGAPVWTAITVWLVVFVKGSETVDELNQWIERQVDIACQDDSRTIRIPASRFNQSIVIQQVMADVDLRIPFHKDFVRASNTPQFNINALSNFTQLEQCRDLRNIVMDSVVKLEVLGGGGDNFELTARRLQIDLTVFPAIVDIPDSVTSVRMEESAKHLLRLLPSLKHLVVKLFFNSNLDKQDDIERIQRFLDLLLHVGSPGCIMELPQMRELFSPDLLNMLRRMNPVADGSRPFWGWEGNSVKRVCTAV
ncbi:hypothetical protein HDU93_009959 [Gonapodya sp. JEL0774]|nr:hypothetical protein HDU93_009959 [Gonapodya sp. JEL0774]